MDEAIVLDTLWSACQPLELNFQVVWGEPYLYVYINRSPEQELDYEALALTISQAVGSLFIPSVQGICLYSRILGVADAEWETYLNLSSPVVEEEETKDDFPENLELNEEETIDDFTENSAEELSEPSGFGLNTIDNFDFNEIEPELSDSVEEIADTTGSVKLNFDEIQETGSEPADSIEEIPQEQVQAVTETLTLTEAIEQLTDEEQPLDLSEYCFVTNPETLTEPVVNPSQKIIQLIQTLELMSDVEKKNALTLLKQWSNESSESPNLSEIADPVKTWLRTIIQADHKTIKNIFIWISRYCLNSQDTLQEIANKTLAEPLDTELENIPKEPRKQPQRVSFPSQTLTPKKPKFSRSALIAIVSTAILAPLTIGVVLSRLWSSSTTTLCQGYQKFPNYCQLALQIIDHQQLEEISIKSSEITPEVTEKLKLTCEEIANSKNSIPMAFKSTAGDIILPGIYLVDIQKTPTLRTACILRFINGKTNLLATAEIPQNWPDQPYQPPESPWLRRSAGGFKSF